MSDWHRLGISDLQGTFAREEMSPTQYLEYMLARIDAHNPTLNAFVEIDRENAFAAAAVSDARFAEDNQRPLEGVVIGVKSNISVKGLELNAGAEARRGLIADEDAEAVERLRDAGAVIIGTLNMHEMALGATNNNPWFGACYNPHGDGLTPGGSSGGSSCAVAAGLCTAALGTDTLGSVRIPGAYCGVYAMKPTTGAISSRGLLPFSNRFDSIGPMARSLEDVSVLSHILFTPDLSTAMRRSHFLQLAENGGVSCQPDVAAAFATVLSELPTISDYVSLGETCERIRTAAFILAVRELIGHIVTLGEQRCAELSEEVSVLIDFAISRSEIDLAEDERIVEETADILRREIASNGVLITPTTPQTAFRQGDVAPSNQADFTALANIAGLPSLTIPIGRDENDLPIGIQLTGPVGGEAMLIAQARMINDKIRGYASPPNYS
jgi:aspartyl-tRNA(Asn)/glutamyl-tRNA(Gln) amidotransferase subunit A